MRKIRIDFAIPMLIAFGVGALVNFGGGKFIDYLEEKSKEEVYSDSMIGAAATDKVPVVSNIEEMMEEDYFTFYAQNYSSMFNTVYYEGSLYDAYEMESGEIVVVDDYYLHSHLDSADDSDWSMDFYMVMPIGQVIHEPLDQELIDKFEETGYTITDTSFYVDMRGDFKDFSRDDCENKLELICAVVGILVFIVIRLLMIASGLFPPLFPLRFLKSWKKYIVYYGILYYGENMEQILAYRKQKRFEEAAAEFSKLTGATIYEARAAMNSWNEFYGEGFITMGKN